MPPSFSSRPQRPPRPPLPHEIDPEIRALDYSVYHHDRFYIDDDLVVFLVESRLFKVHRYFFARESEFFQGMFELPMADNSVEGKCDGHPIVLPDVTIGEFECLLNFLYYGMHNEKVNVDFWIRLLSISTRLSFERARTRAIEEIDRYGDLIDPVEKITLARNCDVPEWLTPAYERICLRIKPLDLDEAKVVGMETAVLLGQAREVMRKRSIKDSPKHPPLKSRPNPLYDNIEPSLVTRTVKETFWRYTQGL